MSKSGNVLYICIRIVNIMNLKSSLYKILKSSLLTLVILSAVIMPFHTAHAINDPGGGGGDPTAAVDDNDVNCNTDISDAGKDIFCGGADKLEGDSNVLQTVIDNIVNIMVGLIGSVLAIVILVSAIQIVASSGSPDAMKSAKNRLTQAAISLGLLVSFRAILALLGI